MWFVRRARQFVALQVEHVRMLPQLEGWDSRRRFLGLLVDRWRHGERTDPPAATAVSLRVRALGGRPLYVRPRSSDIDAISAVFVHRWFLPPVGLGEGSVRRVVEIGSNIGVALAALAARYPAAEMLGVEPDAENAELARRNVAAFDGRCTVVQAAAWDRRCQLTVERVRREWGLVVRPRRPEDPPDWPTIDGQPVEALLDALHPGEPIDYLFMDVEGTEGRLLDGEPVWPARVRSIRLESEHEYGSDTEGCVSALERLGFQTSIERHDWGAYVFGIR